MKAKPEPPVPPTEEINAMRRRLVRAAEQKNIESQRRTDLLAMLLRIESEMKFLSANTVVLRQSAKREICAAMSEAAEMLENECSGR